MEGCLLSPVHYSEEAAAGQPARLAPALRGSHAGREKKAYRPLGRMRSGVRCPVFPGCHREKKKRWRMGPESNRRHAVLRTAALPAELPIQVPGIRRAEETEDRK